MNILLISVKHLKIQEKETILCYPLTHQPLLDGLYLLLTCFKNEHFSDRTCVCGKTYTELRDSIPGSFHRMLYYPPAHHLSFGDMEGNITIKKG